VAVMVASWKVLEVGGVSRRGQGRQGALAAYA
jgi:hypothetical protein